MRGGEDADGEPFGATGLGPIRRRTYELNPKHGPIDLGRISRAPVNGQDALDYSVHIERTPKMRVGVDYDDHAFVVLRFHDLGEFRDSLNYERFHGYVAEWRGLSQEQRNALMRWGFVNLRGKIR